MAFASRTLSAAEKKYAHLDKEEGLAIVFGVEKFNSIHGYLENLRFARTTSH